MRERAGGRVNKLRPEKANMSVAKVQLSSMMEQNDELMQQNALLQGQVNQLEAMVKGLIEQLNAKNEMVSIDTHNRFDVLEVEGGDDDLMEINEERRATKRQKPCSPVPKQQGENIRERKAGEPSARPGPLAERKPKRDNTEWLKEVAVRKEKMAEANKKATEKELNNTKAEKTEGLPKLTGRIVVKDLNAKEVTRKLEELKIKFRLMRTERKDETMIACEAAYRKLVIETLREAGQKGHSYLPREERLEIRLLKGINFSFDAVDVQEDITRQGVKEESFLVERFSTPSSNRNGRLLPFFVVKAESKEIMEKITGLRSICFTKPKWTEFEKREVTQCYNCFGVGHTKSAGCLNEWRCRKCGSSEANHECTVTKREPGVDEKGVEINRYADYTCCKCGQKGHSPEWRRCPKFQQEMRELERIKERRSENREKKFRARFEDAPPPREMAWKIPETRNAPPRAAQGDIRSEIEALMGMTWSEMDRLTNDFMTRYEKIKTDGEKRQEVAAFFLAMKGWKK